MQNAKSLSAGVLAMTMLWSVLAASSAYASGAAGNNAAATAPDSVLGVWQHRKVTMSYFGITSLYTCDGLEERVRQLLLYLGARKDLTVRASGCVGGWDTPSRSAWVNADFYSLVPAADATASGTVRAHWTPLEVTSRRPNFMSDGDCELIQNMKDLTVQNFTLRDVEYRTTCVPNEVTMDGYSIKGEALRLAPPPPAAVTG